MDDLQEHDPGCRCGQLQNLLIALACFGPVKCHTCHLLRQKPALGEQPVLLLVDTAGCDMEEVAEEGGDSTSNPGEAQVLCSRDHPTNI